MALFLLKKMRQLDKSEFKFDRKIGLIQKNEAVLKVINFIINNSIRQPRFN